MTASLATASERIRRYTPSIDTFMPCLDDEEKRLRCGILYMRDKALNASRFARYDAAAILETVAMIATRRAYQAMPIEHVRELRASLLRLMLTASALEARGPGSPPDDAE